MESCQAANVFLLRFFFGLKKENSGITIPERTDMRFFISVYDFSSLYGSRRQTNAQYFSQ